MPVHPTERFTAAESYQRRIDTGEWNPSAMTDEERLASKRFDSYFAFETQPQPKRKLSPDQFKDIPDAG